MVPGFERYISRAAAGTPDLRRHSRAIAVREYARLVSWEAEISELRRREALARELGGPERVARQHASGRLTVLVRIERLLDPGSFQETGTIAGVADYDSEGALSRFR